MKPLDLAIPARRVGRRDDVADVALGEELGEGTVVGVVPGAVSHDALGGDAMAGEPGQGTLDERRRGSGRFVVEQFAVGQS
jgi:hypothetical protein